MKCTVCGKETNVHNDGGIAIMMAVSYGHSTSFLNNSYCKDCYEKLIKKHLIKLSSIEGMEIPSLK